MFTESFIVTGRMLWDSVGGGFLFVCFALFCVFVFHNFHNLFKDN